MERNERFTQQHFHQYENNLSPFGQKILNVLLNNWNKEKHCSQNRYNNGGGRRYGKKRKLLNFDDPSTARQALFSQSEQLGYDSSQNPYPHNKDRIIGNEHGMKNVLTTAELFPIDIVRKNYNAEISSIPEVSLFQFKPFQNNTTESGPNARLQQLASTQNNPREDVPNITAATFRLSSPVQKKALQKDPSIISAEFQFNTIQNNPKTGRSSVVSEKINKFKSEHKHLFITEDNTHITSAGFLQLNSKQNNYTEHRHNVTSVEPDLKPTNDCYVSITSQSLLQFKKMQDIDKERTPNINPTIPVPLDSVLRTAKENIMHDDDHDDCSSGLFFSPVKENAVEDSGSVCNLDLLRSLEFSRSTKPDKPFSKSCHTGLDNFTFNISAPIDGNQAHHMEKGNIVWDDMFDTELLPNDVISPAVEEKIIDEHDAAENHKQFKMFFLEENTKEQEQTDKNKEVNKCKPGKRKSKKEKTHNKERNPKKLKETNIKNRKKNIVRKEKYTKSVKTWLNTLDPSNITETGENQENGNADSNKSFSGKIVDNIIIEDKNSFVPKKQIVAKKVVQARLANKGGVMKFDKPEELQNNGINDPSGNTTTETTSKSTNKVNLKKGKPKFVAPLKSQIPVKEIEYNVVVVDKNNSKEHLLKLQNLNTSEVYAVLTYSNGFCQLNKQFTEDDCVPAGGMLLINEDFYYFQKTADTFSDVIVKFLENHTVVCYNGKNILIFFQHHFDMEINICMHDFQIAGSLLEPDNPPDSFGALQKLANSAPQYTVSTTCVLQKTAWYLTLLRECADKLKSKLLDNSLWSLFQDIEMPVLPIIAEMEFHGILVDTEKLQSMEAALLRRMLAVERRCGEAAGGPLRLRSPAALAAMLYDRLQLHTRAGPAARAALARGHRSTSEDMLRRLAPLHPLPALLRQYRRLHKAHATFLAGVRHHVAHGVLRPTWVQTAAATGRIASNNPNVQAIPKTLFNLSSDADEPEEALNLRSVYVARPGHVLLAADFRQMECRVFASVAADRVLLDALSCGRDLFTVLAAQWLNKPEEQVSGADRERTKRIVYASLYGAGVSKLMTILDVSYEQAASISASFHSTFSSLKRFEQSVWGACQGGRAPRTWAGRARALPALAAHDHAQRARAQRQALNFLVQGTAADVCKVAMARAQAALRAAGARARLLLQLHDELLWELPADQLPRAHAVLGAAMEGSGARAGLAVPLPVLLRAGRSWGELRDLPPPPDAS